MSKVQPKASIDVICVDNTKDQTSKYCEIDLTPFTKVLEHELKNKLLRLSELMNMEYPEHFEPVVINGLASI